jgi:hypothetical protein
MFSSLLDHESRGGMLLRILPRPSCVPALIFVVSLGFPARANESSSGTFNKIARLFSPEFRRLDDRRAQLQRSPLPKLPPSCVSPSLGYHSISRVNADTTEWVQIDLGSSQPLDAIVLVPAASPSADAISGYYFPVRFRLEISDNLKFAQSRVIADHTAADFPAPGARPVIMTAEAARPAISGSL